MTGITWPTNGNMQALKFIGPEDAVLEVGSGRAAFKVRLGKYKIELGSRKKTLDIRLPTTDVTL